MPSISYLEAGSGPSVFLLHAFPLDHRMWDAQIQALAARYRVIAPDLPGFGGSPESRTAWRLSDVALEILEIAEALEQRRFSIAGLSMGTYAAFEVYRRGPDRVDRMILASGKARADTPEERQARQELARLVESHGVGILEEKVLPRLLGPDPGPDVVGTVREAIRRARVLGVTRALDALAGRRDSTSLLGNIRCPVLVIAGSEDAITTPAECRQMADAVPQATYAEIPQAGHLTNLENPEAFNAALTRFLERATPGDSE